MHDLTQQEYQNLLLEHNNFKHAIEDLQNRVDKCETQQEAMGTLTLSVDRLTHAMSTMVSEQKELKADIKALKEAPTEDMKYYKRTIISCILTTIVGAVIGAVISIILL